MNAKFKNVLSSLRWVKWFALYLGLAVLATLVAVLVWVRFQSLDYYKAEAVERMKTHLDLRSASIGKLEWDFSVSTFAFGVKATNVRGTGVKQLRDIKIPEAKASLRLWRLLTGKVALDVSLREPFILFQPTPAGAPIKAATAAKPEASAAAALQDAPLWLRFVRVSLKMTDAHARLQGEQESSQVNLDRVELRAVLSGFPGSFSATLEGEVESDWNVGEYIAKGPVELDAEGTVQSIDGKAVGILVDRFEANLSKTEFRMLRFLEKTSDMPLELKSEIQVMLPTAPGEQVSFEWKKGSLRFDELEMTSHGTHSFRGTDFLWLIPQTEVRALRVPVQDLRKIPFAGLVESSGQIHVPTGGDMHGGWKFGFNNLRAEGSALKNVGGAGLVSGGVTLSFVSEGFIEKGRFSSPRTELQFKGTDAQISFFNRNLVKPKGDDLDLLLRMKIQDDKVLLEKFHLRFHALNLEAQGELASLSTYLAGKPSPVKLEVQSNRIDLSRWSQYFPDYQKAPAFEGLAEVAGALEGKLRKGDGALDDVSWRVDRFHVSHLKANFFANTAEQLLITGRSGIQLRGPLQINLLFQGRGIGTRVERASLVSQADLSKANLFFKDEFRKSADTPFVLDVSMEQSRNQLKISKGYFQFHTLDLAFNGLLQPGTRKAALNVSMKHPVLLSEWKAFFVKSPDIPLDGRILWTGKLTVPTSVGMEESFDWSKLGVEGELKFDRLTGRFGGMAHPVRNARGRLVLRPGGVSLSGLAGTIGETNFQASGDAQILGASVKAHAPLLLSQLMTAKAWNISAELGLSRLAMEDWEDRKTFEAVENRAANMKREAVENVSEQMTTLLNNPYLAKSQLRVALRAGQGAFGNVAYKNLLVRALWDKQSLRLQPLSVEALGGRIAGNVRFDAGPFYNRKENPEIQSSFTVTGLNVKEAAVAFKPEMAKLVAGALKAEINLSTSGLESKELIENASGRVNGTIERGEFETFMFLRGSLEEMVSNEAVRKLLLNQVRQEQCIQKQFTAAVDAQLKGGTITLDSGRFRFATGSEIRMKGTINQQMALELDGEFLASNSCISGDAQKCLAGPENLARFPLRLRGTASEPKGGLDYRGLTGQIAACTLAKAKASAKQMVTDAQQGKLDDLKNKAQDRLKKIFK